MDASFLVCDRCACFCGYLGVSWLLKGNEDDYDDKIIATALLKNAHLARIVMYFHISQQCA